VTGTYFARKPVGNLRGAADLRRKTKGTFHHLQAINQPRLQASHNLSGDMMTFSAVVPQAIFARLGRHARTSERWLRKGWG
jgi:hypothetical protein